MVPRSAGAGAVHGVVQAAVQAGGDHGPMGQPGAQVPTPHPINARLREHPREQLPARSDAREVSAVRTEQRLPHPEHLLRAQGGQVRRLRAPNLQIRDQVHLRQHRTLSRGRRGLQKGKHC